MRPQLIAFSALFATFSMGSDVSWEVGNNNDTRYLMRTCQEFPSFEPSADVETVVSFYAMGDTPYSLEQKYCLNEQLRGLNMTDDDALFQVHVGDIKRGRWPCNYTAYNDIAEMYVHPNNAVDYDPRDSFFVVGDNEFSDCKKPEEAWKIWTEHFGINNRYGFGTFSPEKNVRVTRQTGSYRLPGVDRSENFAFFKNGVVRPDTVVDTLRFPYLASHSLPALFITGKLFIGLNIIGGKSYGNEGERMTQNLQWCRRKLQIYQQKDMKAAVLFGHSPITVRGTRKDFFGEPFRVLLREVYPELPVLYVHGDWHDYCVRQLDDDNENFWGLEVEDGGFAPPVLVSIVRNKDPNDDRYLFKVDQRGGLYSPLGACKPIYERTWPEVPETEGPQYTIIRNPQRLLKECEGDCDNDGDCEGDLLCFEDDSDVPNCSGFRVSGTEYCFNNSTTPSPSFSPDFEPTLSPSMIPLPSSNPSSVPSGMPSSSAAPSSAVLSETPSGMPSSVPSVTPSIGSSEAPSLTPSSENHPDMTSPTSSPTFHPTLTPTGLNKMPSLKELVIAAYPPHLPNALSLCQAHCKRHADCAVGLRCFFRDGFEKVPGCTGVGKKQRNYCYNPDSTLDPTAAPTASLTLAPTATLPKLIWKGLFPSRKLKACQGNCVDDFSCKGNLGLKCFIRRGFEKVPGCHGRGKRAKNYCYKPDSNGDPTAAPTPSLTPAPTAPLPKLMLKKLHPSRKLKACQGNCIDDSSCRGKNLKCFIRQKFERVPGCRGRGKRAKNYCYREIVPTPD